MTLAAGSLLGPYEVLAPLGAGGMGEVYRARDPRLGREVAIKVLPQEFVADEARRHRFEREARLLGALNHPGIAAIYAFEEVEGPPPQLILTMELLEGETLRARLARGPLPVRQAIELAAQAAHALAAAHDKGILHRDLKPENVFLLQDGRLKVLDFGLAKHAPPGARGEEASRASTVSTGTLPGTVLGTIGYMSPEQARGEALDARSDIFSFGAVLHEMLAGRRAFQRASLAETLAAVLQEDPPDLAASNPHVPAALERIVRRCLAKHVRERYQSARDLALDLESLAAPVPARETPRRRGPRPPWLLLAFLATAVAAAALSGLVVRRLDPPRAPSFRQVTFRRGFIWSARFGDDPTSLYYAAAWDGGPLEVYAGRTDSPDWRGLVLANANLLAVAPRGGDLAVTLDARLASPDIFCRVGTLARVAAAGGTPRALAEDVEAADYAAHGGDLAFVRVVGDRRRLEYPAGKVLYETTGWIGNPRLSPRGDTIAFVDHPVFGDDGGTVALVDLAGRKTTLTPSFATAQGLAWSADGREVWFTAVTAGGNRALRAVTPAGAQRVLFEGPCMLTLHDVGRDGRALVAREQARVGFSVGPAAGAGERDLSWLDWSDFAALSPDGRAVAFTECSSGGQGYKVYLRGTDGAPAVLLGPGLAQSLSPDGSEVLAIVDHLGGAHLVAYPTGPGAPRPIRFPGLTVRRARWLPDGRGVLIAAARDAERPRIYLADPRGGGAPRPLTPEGHNLPVGNAFVDARRFLSSGPDGRPFLGSLDGNAPLPVPGLGPDDVVPGAFRGDGTILVRRGLDLPARLVWLDVDTGRETPLREILPADPAGITTIGKIAVSADGRTLVYEYERRFSELYVVDGVR